MPAGIYHEALGIRHCIPEIVDGMPGPGQCSEHFYTNPAVTFGRKAGGSSSEQKAALSCFTEVLIVQFGGVSGTLASPGV